MKGYNFFIARVTSIILGPWDSGYKNNSDIGKIKFQVLYSPLGIRRTKSISDSGNKPAYPISPFLKQYPVIGEIVYIMIGPSPRLNDDYNSQRLYYSAPFDLWNDSNHNGFPDLEDYADYINESSNKPTYSGNSATGSNMPLGNTFKEKYVQNLQPFEGDTILQSRFGQSIRFGSTNSELKKQNTWSSSGNTGDPITIILNRQDINPRDQKSLKKFNSFVEDINKQGSAIYMTSTQEIFLEDINKFPLRSFGVGINSQTQKVYENTKPVTVPNDIISDRNADNKVLKNDQS